MVCRGNRVNWWLNLRFCGEICDFDFASGVWESCKMGDVLGLILGRKWTDFVWGLWNAVLPQGCVQLNCARLNCIPPCSYHVPPRMAICRTSHYWYKYDVWGIESIGIGGLTIKDGFYVIVRRNSDFNGDWSKESDACQLFNFGSWHMAKCGYFVACWGMILFNHFRCKLIIVKFCQFSLIIKLPHNYSIWWSTFQHPYFITSHPYNNM